MSITIPCYFKYAATGLDCYRRIEKTPAYSGNGSGACPCSACQCFTCTSFENAESDRVTVFDFHETGVDPVRETFVIFDKRALQNNRRLVDISDNLNRMGVSHGYDRNVDFLRNGFVVQEKRPDYIVACRGPFQAIGVERNSAEGKYGFAHVDSNCAVILNE